MAKKKRHPLIHSDWKKLPRAETIYIYGEAAILQFEDGNCMRVRISREMTWISAENLGFAVIEPNLFEYYTLPNGLLVIACELINETTVNLAAYLTRLEKEAKKNGAS